MHDDLLVEGNMAIVLGGSPPCFPMRVRAARPRFFGSPPSLPAMTYPTATKRALALALLVASACSDQPPGPWNDGPDFRWRDIPVRGSGAGFEAVRGIDFQNTVSDSVLLGNRYLGQGAGVALGDVDGDGLVDVFLARTEGGSVLYRNLGDWRFEDITARAGLTAPNRYATGAVFADIDGDGDLDLILLATLGPDA